MRKTNRGKMVVQLLSIKWFQDPFVNAIDERILEKAGRI